MKHQEGVKQLRQYVFADVSAENETFNTRSWDQKTSMFPVLVKGPKQEPEAGDLQTSIWVKYDDKLTKSFMLFASLRNGELDAYELDEEIVEDRMRFLKLMIVCTRGRFLSDIPGVNGK